MRVKPAVPAFDRLVTSGRRLTESWAGSPRAVDVLTALGCLGLMALDLPGLAAADNSLTGPTAAVVLTLGCATLLVRRRQPWISYLAALLFIGWLHEFTLIQFALYSVGRYRGRRAGILATLGYLGFALVMFCMPDWPAPRGRPSAASSAWSCPSGCWHRRWASPPTGTTWWRS